MVPRVDVTPAEISQLPLSGRWNEGGHVACIVESKKEKRHKYPVENSKVTFHLRELQVYGEAVLWCQMNRLNVWAKPNYINMLSNSSLFVNGKWASIHSQNFYRGAIATWFILTRQYLASESPVYYATLSQPKLLLVFMDSSFSIHGPRF